MKLELRHLVVAASLVGLGLLMDLCVMATDAQAVVVCQKKGKIKLRPDACVAKEDTVIDLTEALATPGPEGPQGPAGPAGVAGAAGATGPAGQQGAEGLAGSAGATGPAGQQGAQGLAGPAGATGPAGQQGAQGLAGPAGAAGATGPAGQQGAQGPQGPAGPAGAAGPKGDTGDPGPPGPGGGGGLRVVDATGKEVGAVLDAGEFATKVIRQVTLPNGPGPEWFLFFVDGGGFKARYSGYYDYFLYAQPNCGGNRYEYDYYGAAANPLAIDVSIGEDGVTGLFGRPSEAKLQQYYRKLLISDPSPAGAFLQCTTDVFSLPGSVIGDDFPCEFNPSLVCVNCCQPRGRQFVGPRPESLSPVREMDVSDFGLAPPFKIER